MIKNQLHDKITHFLWYHYWHLVQVIGFGLWHHYWHLVQVIGFGLMVKPTIDWIALNHGLTAMCVIEYLGLMIGISMAVQATLEERKAKGERAKVTVADQFFHDMINKGREVMETAIQSRDELAAQCLELRREISAHRIEQHQNGGKQMNDDEILVAIESHPTPVVHSDLKGDRIFQSFSQEEVVRILARQVIHERGFEIQIGKEYNSVIYVTNGLKQFRVEVILPE